MCKLGLDKKKKKRLKFLILNLNLKTQARIETIIAYAFVIFNTFVKCNIINVMFINFKI